MGYRSLQRRILLILCSLAVGATALGVQSASSAADDTFFKGKTIRIVVAFSAGGGFDLYTRAIGRHMGRFIPGNPRFLVQNMTGAGGLISANYMYKKAKPNGLTIGTFPGSLFWAKLFGQRGIQFVPGEYEFLGIPESTISVCSFTTASGITDMEKWLNSPKPVKLAGTGPGNSTTDGPRLLEAALGVPIKLIEGYTGAAGMLLAAERGEVDGTCGLSWTAMSSNWESNFKSGRAAVVLQMSGKKHAQLPNVPLDISFAKTEEARLLIKAGIHDPAKIMRIYALPPGTPKGHVKTLRTAFMKTMRDPQFLEDAKRTRLNIDPSDGIEVQKVVDSLDALSPKVVQKLKSIVLPKK